MNLIYAGDGSTRAMLPHTMMVVLHEPYVDILFVDDCDAFYKGVAVFFTMLFCMYDGDGFRCGMAFFRSGGAVQARRGGVRVFLSRQDRAATSVSRQF